MAGPKPLADPVARARSSGSGAAPHGGFAALVPELGVTDLERSLHFWRDLLGFAIAYDRPAARFAYLTRGSVQIMLYQINGSWETAELEYPFGRGINFQTKIEPLDPVLAALAAVSWPLFEGPREAWYRVGEAEHGQRECLVQDPDGYLVRLVESLGIRAAVGD
ncbi:bleomycin resistance protein [Methylobacterium sp.]|uniref:bleomycin resistance protein n=1 Tax=Methylobacterium sp. TaxID=409 RepID=UPI0011C7DE7E|nr:VOC family protein [Methylobacterium sp. WL64]